MTGDSNGGIKSAYERALERLDEQGIDRPRQTAYSVEIREQMDAVRQQAKAKLAEIEIMHLKELERIQGPEQRLAADEEHRIDRQRIESDCEKKLQALRKH